MSECAGTPENGPGLCRPPSDDFAYRLRVHAQFDETETGAGDQVSGLKQSVFEIDHVGDISVPGLVVQDAKTYLSARALPRRCDNPAPLPGSLSLQKPLRLKDCQSGGHEFVAHPQFRGQGGSPRARFLPTARPDLQSEVLRDLLACR